MDHADDGEDVSEILERIPSSRKAIRPCALEDGLHEVRFDCSSAGAWRDVMSGQIRLRGRGTPPLQHC